MEDLSLKGAEDLARKGAGDFSRKGAEDLALKDVEELGFSEEALALFRKHGIRTFGELCGLAGNGQLEGLGEMDRGTMIGILKRIRLLAGRSLCSVYFGD